MRIAQFFHRLAACAVHYSVEPAEVSGITIYSPFAWWDRPGFWGLVSLLSVFLTGVIVIGGSL